MAGPDLSSTLIAASEAYLNIFATLDTDTSPPILSENHRHVFAPSSANIPPPLDRPTFVSHLKQLREVMQSFTVRAEQIWPNPSLKQTTVWATSLTQFHAHLRDNDDEEEWNYRGEYIFVLSMDDTGEKVQHVLEFLDSKGTDRLRGLMARARQKREEQSGSK